MTSSSRNVSVSSSSTGWTSSPAAVGGLSSPASSFRRYCPTSPPSGSGPRSDQVLSSVPTASFSCLCSLSLFYPALFLSRGTLYVGSLAEPPSEAPPEVLLWFLSFQDGVIWTMSRWCQLSVGLAALPPGCGPAAVLRDTRGTSVAAAQPGSSGPTQQGGPSAPASPAAAEGGAATHGPGTATQPMRQRDS